SCSPGRIQQPTDLSHALPAFLTTAVAVFFDRVKNGFGDVTDEVVVDIHHDDRWSAAKALSLPVPSGGKHLLVTFCQYIIPNGHMGLLCATMPDALRGRCPQWLPLYHTTGFIGRDCWQLFAPSLMLPTRDDTVAPLE